MGGSSGHLNHIATYDGVSEYIHTQTQKNKGIHVIAYALKTIPLYRRYVPFLNIFFSLFAYYRKKYMFTAMNKYNREESNKNIIVYRVYNPWLAWNVFYQHT